jgi:hypothetical protein
MLNKTTKGRRSALMARKLLEADNWLVDAKPHTKYQSPDFYGQFDLLAVRGSDTRLIQVKSNMSHFYTARKAIKEWIAKTGVTIPCECWCYTGRGEWRREVINS